MPVTFGSTALSGRLSLSLGIPSSTIPLERLPGPTKHDKQRPGVNDAYCFNQIASSSFRCKEESVGLGSVAQQCSAISTMQRTVRDSDALKQFRIDFSV